MTVPDAVLEHRNRVAIFRERGKRADEREVNLQVLECLIDILEALKKK